MNSVFVEIFVINIMTYIYFKSTQIMFSKNISTLLTYTEIIPNRNYTSLLFIKLLMNNFHEKQPGASAASVLEFQC